MGECDEGGIRVTETTADFDEWAMSDGEREFTLHIGGVFTSQLPELVAAGEVLASFKRAVVALRPLGDPFPQRDEGVLARWLARKEELSELLIEIALERRNHRRQMLELLGIQNPGSLSAPSGDPQISVNTAISPARVVIRWSAGKAHAEFQSAATDQWIGEDLHSVVEVAPAISAYRDLRRDIETLIGTPLSSATWSAARDVPGWTL